MARTHISSMITGFQEGGCVACSRWECWLQRGLHGMLGFQTLLRGIVGAFRGAMDNFSLCGNQSCSSHVDIRLTSNSRSAVQREGALYNQCGSKSELPGRKREGASISGTSLVTFLSCDSLRGDDWGQWTDSTISPSPKLLVYCVEAKWRIITTFFSNAPIQLRCGVRYPWRLKWAGRQFLGGKLGSGQLHCTIQATT